MTKFYLVQRMVEGPGGKLEVSVKSFSTQEMADKYAEKSQRDLMSALGQKVGTTGFTMLDFFKSFGVHGVAHPVMEVDVHEADLIQLPGVVRPS